MSPTKAIFLGVSAALAAIAGLVVANLAFTPPTLEITSGTLLPQPRAVAPFTLTDEENQPFAAERLKGHWTVVFAGFTYCPDVCPTVLAMLKNVEAKLAAQGKSVNVLFVSVDQERDTPERIRNYVHYFSPAFDGVTGSFAELDKLAASLSIVYAKAPGETAESYSVDHSANLILIDPQGAVAGFLTPPFKTDDITADLAALVKEKT